VRIGDIAMGRTENIPDCPCCGKKTPCGCCVGGNGPNIIKATIGGVVNGACGAGCQEWNAEHNLNARGDDSCEWVKCQTGHPVLNPCSDDMPCDDGTMHVTDIHVQFVVPCSVDGSNLINVNVHQNGSAVALFSKTIIGLADCTNIGNVPLFNGFGLGACDWSAGTCNLSS